MGNENVYVGAGRGRSAMNGSTENRTSGSFENSNGQEIILTWGSAERMLPLVSQIVAEILGHQTKLNRIQPEKDRLDRNRRNLDWPERSRRYGLQEEIAQEDLRIAANLAELDALGLTLVEPMLGQVGFPTLVNNRKAFFSWQPGEETIQYWHFAEDLDRRPIPATWMETSSKFCRPRMVFQKPTTFMPCFSNSLSVWSAKRRSMSAIFPGMIV